MSKFPVEPAASAVSPASLALGGAAAVGGAVYNEWSQREAERRAQRNYVKNAKMNFEFAQQAERNSAYNQKLGLIHAGMNPALASEGKFSGVAGAAAPLQAAQGQRIDPLTMSQLMNDATQRAYTESKKEEQDIKNTRLNDEDATYDLNMRNWIDGQLSRTDISKDYRQMLESMRGNTHPYSKGSFDSLDKFIELTPKMQEQIFKKTTAEYQTKILEVKEALKQYEWVARMDTATFDKLVSETAQIQMNTSLLAAKTGLTRIEANKLMAETQKLMAEASSISNGNVVELWTNGEWKKLMAFYGDKAIGAGLDLVGVAGKAKVAGKLTKGLTKNLSKFAKQSQKFSAPKVTSSHSRKPKAKSYGKSRSKREASTVQGSLKFPR